jgi:hypothetical protein
LSEDLNTKRQDKVREKNKKKLAAIEEEKSKYLREKGFQGAKNTTRTKLNLPKAIPNVFG